MRERASPAAAPASKASAGRARGRQRGRQYPPKGKSRPWYEFGDHNSSLPADESSRVGASQNAAARADPAAARNCKIQPDCPTTPAPQCPPPPRKPARLATPHKGRNRRRAVVPVDVGKLGFAPHPAHPRSPPEVARWAIYSGLCLWEFRVVERRLSGLHRSHQSRTQNHGRAPRPRRRSITPRRRNEIAEAARWATANVEWPFTILGLTEVPISGSRSKGARRPPAVACVPTRRSRRGCRDDVAPIREGQDTMIHDLGAVVLNGAPSI